MTQLKSWAGVSEAGMSLCRGLRRRESGRLEDPPSGLVPKGQGVTKRERKAGAQSDFRGCEKPPTSVRWKGCDLI